MLSAPRSRIAQSLLAAACIASLAAATRAQSPAWHHVYNADIRDVFVWTDPSDASSHRVWTCEDGSRIRYFETGASSWTFQSTPDSATQALLDIYVRDGAEGWACGMGGTILHDATTSGTWSALTPLVDDTVSPSVPAVLWGIRFATSDDGFVCGDHLLKWTDNAGTDWHAATLPSGVDADETKFYAIEIVPGSDALELVVGAEIEETNSVMLYSDGGTSWNVAEILDVDGFSTVLPEEFDTWDVVFEPNTGNVSSAVGIMVGGVGSHDGHVFRTTNGGKTWREEVMSPSPAETMYGAHAWRSGEAIACGYGGNVYKRNSSTGVWSRIYPGGGATPCITTGPFTAPLNAASGNDAGNLWVVGSFGSLRESTNGGTTLAQVTNPLNGGQMWRLNDSQLLSSTLGWVVGEVGAHRMNVSGGLASFTTEQCTYGDTWLKGIAVKSSTEGWAVGTEHAGSGHVIWHRDTSGSWTTETSGVPSGADLTDVAILPSGGAVAVGLNGMVLRRTSSSSTWTQITAPNDATLAGLPTLISVAVAPSGHVFLVGNEGGVGKAYRSPSNFETLSASTPGWIDVSPSTSAAGTTLNSVSLRGALPSLEVYACGPGGVIVKWIRSADQFQTVSGIPSPGGDYRTIALVPSSSEIWVGGTYGTMVHYTGSSWVSVKCQTSKSVHGLSFLDASHGLGLAGQNANPEGSNGDALVIGFD